MRNRQIKLLWISPMAPYNAVGHAGGKTDNFYVKSFSRDAQFDVTLLTYALGQEAPIVRKEFLECEIKAEIIEHPSSFVGRLFWKGMNAETVLNPFNRYAGLTRNQTAIRLMRRLNKIKKESGYTPDIIFLNWTQTVLLAKKIKAMFPHSRIVAVEVDVAFLGYKRHIVEAHNALLSKVWKYKYKKLKMLELQSLQITDKVIVNNSKDWELLVNEMIPSQRIFSLSPFYQPMFDVQRVEQPKRIILFYGAMNREENWKSAIWFIEKVLPKLNDTDIEFHIVGGNPNPILKRYQSERIKILGYVNDLKNVFAESLCLVAPLVLGAGIKVKILEALSAGIPTLTNGIGIEGIPALDGKHYFCCEEPKEYESVIRGLLNGVYDVQRMGSDAKQLVREHFDFHHDATRLKNMLLSLQSADDDLDGIKK